jgi:phage-related protein
VRIQRLAEEGHALRRPEADYLRDGIYELRARQGHVNYRILYFFHGQDMIILAHGMTKENEVPDAEIERARRRKGAFEENPKLHLYKDTHGKDDF